MSKMFECLKNCDLQCWGIENTASLDRQRANLDRTAQNQVMERQIAEGYYTQVIDEATAAGDPELADLARSYARFDRDQQRREDETKNERDQRDHVLENIILPNGSLALRTCEGDVDGLCTGDVLEADRSMLSSYLYRPNEQ